MAVALPLETQTLYAELMEHLIGDKARGPRGGFTTKQVKGETYLYFQASQPGGSTRQYYLGRKTCGSSTGTARDELLAAFLDVGLSWRGLAHAVF